MNIVVIAFIIVGIILGVYLLYRADKEDTKNRFG